MVYNAMTSKSGPWQAGFLSQSGSNVDGSLGADSDIMSMYCTTAASTWKDPQGRAPTKKMESTADTSTGFTKNFAQIQDKAIDDPPEDKFLTTYRRVNNERETGQRNAESQSRTMATVCQHVGSFAAAQCPSPIKWQQDKYKRWGFPSQNLLNIRRKKDPVEWENKGIGPLDFSTSFSVSWTPPDQQEDKCNARATLRSSASSALEKASLSSGWRENNTNPPHPWIHPGVPETTETTYRLTNRVPAKRGGRSEIAPMATSGFSRSQRKIVYGRDMLLPEEKISTTHLNYLAGRISPMAGMLVELNPTSAPGEGFAQSGFCKNLPHPMEVFPRAPEGELPPEEMYSTSTRISFPHPSTYKRDGPAAVDGGNKCDDLDH